MNLIREDINTIDAYKPGKPIKEVEREFGIKNAVKLASNENPLGPSPLALRAIRKVLRGINRYPEGTCFYLKKAVAKVLGVNEENLLFGNGSDELIDIILKVIKAPDAEIVTGDITFVEYKIVGAVNGFTVRTVPLNDFTFDLKAIKNAITKNTRAIFIANPNNPTGTYVTAREVKALLEEIPNDILLVFDEAYIEFVEENDFPDLIPLIEKANIAILRTFSKIYGLAGLRVGYMVADAGFVKAAERIRQPFNVNALAQSAALAALDDKAFVEKTRNLVRREKQYLYNAFDKLGIWFKRSAANFIFVHTQTDMEKLYLKLLKKGVIIREMSSYNLNNYARITIGTRAENRRLIRTLRASLHGR